MTSAISNFFFDVVDILQYIYVYCVFYGFSVFISSKKKLLIALVRSYARQCFIYQQFIQVLYKVHQKRISSCQIFYQTMFLRDGYQILRKKCFSSYALRLSLVTRLWCSVVKNTDTRTLANLVYGYGPYRVRIGIRIFLVHIRSSVSRIRSVMFIVNF